MTHMSSEQPGFVRPPVGTPPMGASQGGPLALVASTDTPGFALQNATPTILSWTAPNDSFEHRVLLFLTLNVSSAETGGALGITFTDPAGNVNSNFQLLAGNQALGPHLLGFISVIIRAGTTISFVQTSALTAGAALAWVEMWGS